MSPRTDNLERLLVTLGEAHQNGAFSSAAARFPWQAEAQHEVQNIVRHRSRWIWVGAPLAAAAAVAVLFVGNAFFPSQSDDLSRIIATNAKPGQPELADAGEAACQGDYNGDGFVDGRDIQALSDRLQNGELDSDQRRHLLAQADELTRCLLDGGR